MTMSNLRRLVLGIAAILFLATGASAQNVRVRGTIEQAMADRIVVKTREGETLTIRLTDTIVVVGVVKQALSDIKPNSFIGTAAMVQPDGTLRALEVLIFPESMRGADEGHYGWDLAPQSTMTNAAVVELVSRVDGTMLKLKYKDGEKTVVVPSDAPIVTFVPGDRSEIMVGAKIFIGAAQKHADGGLQAARIAVGRDGLTPPM